MGVAAAKIRPAALEVRPHHKHTPVTTTLAAYERIATPVWVFDVDRKCVFWANAAALKLWRETGVRVLPGAYLAQGKPGENPGEHYIRVAMVAPKDEMRSGLIRLRDCLY